MIKHFVLGIHGYLGVGKSTAGRFFERKGALYIDADRVVEKLYDVGNEGYRQVRNYFGEEFLNSKGDLNRKKLAKFVFTDPKKLKILHYLIHPLVTNEVQKLIDAATQPVIVLEATYFEEKELLKFVNHMLWIETNREIVLERLKLHKGYDEKRFGQIVEAQRRFLLKQKIDDTIENNDAIEEFEAQLEKVWKNLQELVV
jgi:dephospho-CoA kinase